MGHHHFRQKRICPVQCKTAVNFVQKMEATVVRNHRGPSLRMMPPRPVIQLLWSRSLQQKDATPVASQVTVQLVRWKGPSYVFDIFWYDDICAQAWLEYELRLVSWWKEGLSSPSTNGRPPAENQHLHGTMTILENKADKTSVRKCQVMGVQTMKKHGQLQK